MPSPEHPRSSAKPENPGALTWPGHLGAPPWQAADADDPRHDALWHPDDDDDDDEEGQDEVGGRVGACLPEEQPQQEEGGRAPLALQPPPQPPQESLGLSMTQKISKLMTAQGLGAVSVEPEPRWPPRVWMPAWCLRPSAGSTPLSTVSLTRRRFCMVADH